MKCTSKIVVTGGAGFIGSALLNNLKKIYPNYKLISIDNYISGCKKRHIEGVDYLNDNSGNISELVTGEVDTVFHLGEYSRVEQSFQDPHFVYQNNISQFGNILKFCLKRNAKLIYAASSTRFSNEKHAARLSPYTWAKFMNVETLNNYIDWFGLNAKSIYFYNVYGEGENSDGPFSTVVAKFLKLYKQGSPITITSPGTQTRNFTYIGDIIDGIILIHQKGIERSYKIGAPTSYSINELAGMFPDCELIYTPGVQGNRMGNVDIENDTLRLLGWEPKMQLNDYIVEQIKCA